MKKVLPILLSIMMLPGAVAHLVFPDMYAPLIPEFFPEFLANLFSAVAEAALGILLLIPRYRSLGGLGFMILMFVFLPVHVWDMMRENPFIGPPPVPLIRIGFQFLLIYAGWWVYRAYKTKSIS